MYPEHIALIVVSTMAFCAFAAAAVKAQRTSITMLSVHAFVTIGLVCVCVLALIILELSIMTHA